MHIPVLVSAFTSCTSMLTRTQLKRWCFLVVIPRRENYIHSSVFHKLPKRLMQLNQLLPCPLMLLFAKSLPAPLQSCTDQCAQNPSAAVKHDAVDAPIKSAINDNITTVGETIPCVAVTSTPAAASPHTLTPATATHPLKHLHYHLPPIHLFKLLHYHQASLVLTLVYSNPESSLSNLKDRTCLLCEEIQYKSWHQKYNHLRQMTSCVHTPNSLFNVNYSKINTILIHTVTNLISNLNL